MHQKMAKYALKYAPKNNRIFTKAPQKIRYNKCVVKLNIYFIRIYIIYQNVII